VIAAHFRAARARRSCCPSGSRPKVP
jgi:hypothetical protein